MAKKPKKPGRKTPARKGRARKKSPLFRVVKWGFIGVFAFVLGVAAYLGILSLGLPEVENLPPGEETRIEVLDIEGNLLAVHGAFYGEQLRFIEIPPVMINAITAIEDRRFFEHGAVDFRGVLRALWVNIWNLEVRQGASTITQQLAKNLFLTPERTFTRKARELLLARNLEANYSKQDILGLYLNRVYFGSGAYGIDAAAQRYFGHSAKRLTLAEAALLAGLVKAPSNYTPLRGKDLAYNRAAVVLDAMREAGHIDDETFAAALANPAPIRPGLSGGNIRYFTDWVDDQIAILLGPGREGPFSVYTTLDKTVQEAAEKALDQSLAKLGESQGIGNGAVVVLTPDGSIRALVGGRSYAESQFNRATQARRQPGSAFKPVVYLAGIEAGLEPDDTFIDGPLSIGDYAPKNFDNEYRGKISLLDAFALSINTVAVQVAERAGRERVIRVGKGSGSRPTSNRFRAWRLGFI